MNSHSDPTFPLHDELLRHDRFVRNLARSLLFDETRVDDVVQETWLAVLNHPPEGVVSMRAWLSRVVRNFAYKIARDEGRRVRREAAAARPEAVPSVAEVHERESLRRKIVDAANGLDEPLRTTTLLRYMEGLPPREIAKRLDVPVETVRSRVRIVRERLRSQLDGDYGGDRRAWCLAMIPLAAMGGAGTAGTAAAGAHLGANGEVASAATVTPPAKIAAAALVLVAATATAIAFLRDRDPVPPVETSLLATRSAESDPARLAAGVTTDGVAEDGRDSSTSPTAAGGTLVVRTSSFETGEPLPFVRVDVTPAGSAAAFLELRAASTDADAELRIDDLASGTYAVMPFHDDWSAESVEIRAGAATEIELPLERSLGFDVTQEQMRDAAAGVTGLVLDSHGKPVPGAEIWLYGRTLQGQNARLEGTTDADGRFELRGLFRGMYLGARAPGRAPSAFRRLGAWLDTLGDERRDLRITLGGRGGDLDIHVTGPGGASLAGASVLVHADAHERDGSPVEERPAFWIRTDARGIARAEGLAPDLVPIAVRSEGLGQWHGVASVEAGVTRRVDVTLGHGIVVRGRVLDRAGMPVPRARVRAIEVAYASTHTARTGDDGSFRIEGIGGGDLLLVARARIDGRTESAVERRRVSGDDTLEWSPVIEPREAIRGRVFDDETGAPIGGCRVELVNEAFPADREVKETLPDGTFRFPHRLAESYRLCVFDEDPSRTDIPTRFAMRDGIRPAAEEQVVSLPEIALSGASIRGQIVSKTGDAESSIGGYASFQVTLEHDEAGTVAAFAPDDDGHFLIETIQPGTYRVLVYERLASETVSPWGHACFESDRLELAPGTKRDLGRIESTAPGRLAIRFPGYEAAGALDELRLRVLAFEQNELVPYWIEAGTGGARSGPLPPGRHRLQVSGGHFVDETHDFRIRPGETTSLELALRTGIPVTMRARRLEGSLAEGGDSITMVVSDASGNRTTATTESIPGGDEYHLRFVLAPGAYTVRATTDDGLAARSTFEIAGSDADRRVLELDLR